jgi:hypothetical protein
MYAARRPGLTGPFWRRGEVPEPIWMTPSIADSIVLGADTRLMLAPGAEIAEVACIHGDCVVPGRGLREPRLERPLVFLGEVELAPLLDEVPGQVTLRRLLTRWSDRVGADRARAILRWLVERGLLVDAAG